MSDPSQNTGCYYMILMQTLEFLHTFVCHGSLAENVKKDLKKKKKAENNGIIKSSS